MVKMPSIHHHLAFVSGVMVTISHGGMPSVRKAADLACRLSGVKCSHLTHALAVCSSSSSSVQACIPRMLASS